MTTLDRRSFVTVVGSALGLSAAPPWLARALGPQDPLGDWRKQQLAAAVAAAKAHGKPLLAFVVPPAPDGGKGHQRGQWLGAWLNHGGQAALLELGTCTLACGTAAEIAAATGTEAVPGAPWMVLIDVANPTGTARPRTTPIDVDLGPPWAEHDGKLSADAYAKATLAVMTDGLAKLTKELQAGLHRHGANLANLAAAADAALTPAEREALQRWLGGARADGAELAARATAVVRRTAADLPDEQRAVVLTALAEAITAEVVKERVPGARWQVPGCGASFEEPTPAEKKVTAMVACGMGIVPRLCERFLNFYSAGV